LIIIIFFGFKAIAYAADPEKLKAYYKTYDQCLEQLGLPECNYYIDTILNFNNKYISLCEIFITFKKGRND